MAREQKPAVLGITSKEGAGPSKLRHDSGRFAVNHAKLTKEAHFAHKPEPPKEADLHAETNKDLSELERRAKVDQSK